MRRFVVLCSLCATLCFGSCTGCGIALWANRMAYFRWSIRVGGEYSLVLRHGFVYAVPRYANCAPHPRECESYPIDHRTLSLYYATAWSEHPLLIIPLPNR
jgi:hypothetical protein